MFGLKRNYVSEYTSFINDYLRTHPEVAAGQQTGHALLWNKGPLDEAEQRVYQNARVAPKPYPYQSL